MRLTCILANGYIDDEKKLETLIGFAVANAVEQLTVTPVNKPEEAENQNVWQWTNKHHLLPEQLAAIKTYLGVKGHPLLRLAHGAMVYDVRGQNVCLNNCLSVNPDSEELRNLIFFPDGHLRYYWQYPGSIIV